MQPTKIVFFHRYKDEGINSFCKDRALINRKYAFNTGNKISAEL